MATRSRINPPNREHYSPVQFETRGELVTQIYPIEVFGATKTSLDCQRPGLAFCSGHGETPQAAVEEVEVALSMVDTAKKQGIEIPSRRRDPFGPN